MDSLRRPLLVLVVAATAAASMGCARAVVFATGTRVGIELNAVENGQQTVMVGYKRSEGVFMPVREEDDEAPRKTAFSTLSASNFETGTLLLAGLGSTKVKSVFATGAAASEYNAPKSVSKALHAMYSEILSPEVDWLNSELRASLAAMPDPRKDAARKAVWSELVGNEEVGGEGLLIRMVQREGDKELLVQTLAKVKGSALADDEKEDPGSHLIRLIADPSPGTTGLYDAIAEELEGPDQISRLSEDELVEQLVDLAATDNQVDELRTALGAVLSLAR